METADPSAPAPLDIRQADRLYHPFPDFASWKGLTESDLDLWDRFAKGIEAQRATAPPEAFGRAVEVAMRAAAIETGAIEGLYDVDRGFTMSVATQALAWEHAMAEKGEKVSKLFEAQLGAYELVLDAATRSRPVYEAWIRQLHEILCAAQDTYPAHTPSGVQEHELVKGQYKTLPNHVRLKDGSFHAYAPVDRVPQEMHRLVEILTSPEFDGAHPVLQASYAHYALVNIHPFADGNGRVARALASLYFYRAVSVPLVIFAHQRPSYFDALHAADAGELPTLVVFFRERGIEAMQLVSESLRNALAISSDTVNSIKKLHTKRAGLTHNDLDGVALRLLDTAEREFTDQFRVLSLPEAISIILLRIELSVEAPVGYRRISSSPITASTLLLKSPPPAYGEVKQIFRFVIAKEMSQAFTFLLQAYGIDDDHLEIRLEDVSPELGESFRFRLRLWVERQLLRLLRILDDQGRNALNSLA